MHPFLSRQSAASLPGTSGWGGIHWKIKLSTRAFSWTHKQCLHCKLFHHGGPTRHSEHGDHPGGGYSGSVRQHDHRTLRGLPDVTPGGRVHRGDPGHHHPRHHHRQRARHHIRLHLSPPPERSEHVHCVPGGGGHHRRHPGDAP
ncbi:hypothetical protein CEXT_511491 [Caerostris extrusa]|uniref:Uncharacterized protein n=1 Tax=Caerostris extrusa TaxID=172846 RepID=A0AAV4SRC2_CAEEX|nr:hypothetical protein CEXT_511491 [Caerostris extrusa]